MDFNGLYDAIDEFAKKTPGEIAIQCGNQKINYKELYLKSNKLAKMLVKENLKYNNIALFMDRGIEMVISLIGIIKSGNVFVPLDTSYPQNRISYMLEKSECDTIITTSTYYEELLTMVSVMGLGNKIIIFDDYSYNVNNEFEKVDYIYNEECYIYFSSGSTGEPKGILGRHSSLKQFIDWEIREFGIDTNCRISQISSPSFDACLRDIFVPLCTGGVLCIPKNIDIVLNPLKLVNWIDENKITHVHMVKTLFNNMMNEINDSSKLEYLTYIFLSGEALHGNDIKKFYELFSEKINLINFYGATETTLIKTFHKINASDISNANVSIGKPIDGAKLRILNEKFEECKEDECGEIYIESDYMTFGYYKDEARTKEKFVESKFIHDNTTLMYKTGDLGKLNSDGNYECLGRIDRQMKINGIRIEPGEIEEVLKKHFNMNEVFIIPNEKSNGVSVLSAYYSGIRKFDEEKIKEKLAEQLPSYMIPAIYIYIDKMPLLPNGKVDIKQLILTNNDSKIKVKNFYVDGYEKSVADIICDVMKIDGIAPDDDFLKFGGNSIEAAQIALRLYRKYNVEILITDVLKRRSVKKISEYLRNSRENRNSSIKSDNSKSMYQLTPSQRNIYLLSKMQNVGVSYNLPEVIEINGKIDFENLNRAYKELIKREDSLRTYFKMYEGEPVQVISDDVTGNIEFIDYSNRFYGKKINLEDINKIVKELIKEFNLGNAPLIRMYLIKIEEEKHLLLIDMHHIIGDGRSQELVKIKLSKLIECYKYNEMIEINYRDYIDWINERLKSNKTLEMKNYWKRIYEDNIPILELPTDFNRPSSKTFHGGNVIKCMDKNLVESIRKFAVNKSETIYTFMLTAFLMLLNRYTSQNDIVIGMPVLGRNHPDLENIIGMFVNTIPLRLEVKDNCNFNGLLEQTGSTLIEAMENQEYPFENIVQDLNITPKLSRNQLFDVMFIMQNISSSQLKIDNTTTKRLKIEENRSKFDITLTVFEDREEIYLNFEYSTDLFRRNTIERMANHYENLLRACIDHSDKCINEIEMMSISEKSKIMNHVSKAQLNDLDIEKTFVDFFINQVNNQPNNIALTFKETRITYKELDEMSNYVAKIISDKNLPSNAIVAVMMKRSPLIIVSMIAILKLGHAYLPIDPTYPQDRIKYMIEDSECSLILSGQVEDNDIYRNVINLDFKELMENKLNTSYVNFSHNDKIAYVIYTSGSTGKPKGVMITNKNLSSFILAITKEIKINRYKRILSLTTISFDIFVLESLLPLSQGIEIVLGDEEDQQNPYNISKILCNNKIDLFQATPSRISLVIDALGSTECLKGVKALIIGGEQFPDKILNSLKKNSDIKVFNVYGPTEATVWCAIKDLTETDKITIGKPLANTTMYILNSSRQLQPIGVHGELYISGECLSKGYINNEKMTNEKFIANPFKNDEIMYKTGDIVKLLDDYEIEFIGRSDFQVKLRGYRVELKEIEKAICNSDDIFNCVCDVRCDDKRGQYLVAYYEGKLDVNTSQIRQRLTKKLPEYMIPSIFMKVDALPTTNNGKIDRKNLPTPKGVRPALDHEYKGVNTETEKQILSIWQQILGIDEVGINDNFFEIGGNSLLLVKMHNKLEVRFNRHISIADIFSHPTIFSLAKYICSSEEKVIVKTVKLPQEYFKIQGIRNCFEEYEYEFSEKVSNRMRRMYKTNEALEEILLKLFAYLLYKVNMEEKLFVYRIIDSANSKLGEMSLDMSCFNNFTDIMNKSLNVDLINETLFVEDIKCDELKKRKNEVSIIFSMNKSIPDKINDIFEIITIVENKRIVKIKYYFNSFKINSEKIEEFMTMYVNLIQRVVMDKRYEGGV